MTQRQKEIIEMFDTLRDGSMITWQHVYMEGTYDFQVEFKSNFSPSQIANILDMNSDDFLNMTT
jgi:hypothetical protein